MSSCSDDKHGCFKILHKGGVRGEEGFVSMLLVHALSEDV